MVEVEHKTLLTTCNTLSILYFLNIEKTFPHLPQIIDMSMIDIS